MKNKYKELGCEFENEDKCQERLEDERVDLDEAEKEHFEEDKNSFE